MSFSAYLVGTYERRNSVSTTFQIINPTTATLDIIVAFYDDQEKFQTCLRRQLTSNDMVEINVPREVPNLAPQFGVVKIISHKGGTVMHGIVGYQRHVLAKPLTPEIAFSETGLASVPNQFAQPEYDEISTHCP